MLIHLNLGYKIIDMKSNDPVKTIMSDKLITLHPKDKIKAAKEVFNKYNIHHIPIVVMRKIAGIISQGDILMIEGVTTNTFDKFIQEKKMDLENIESIMSKDVKCVKESESIQSAVDIMVNHRLNALLVTNDELELTGIVTTFDILKNW